MAIFDFAGCSPSSLPSFQYFSPLIVDFFIFLTQRKGRKFGQKAEHLCLDDKIFGIEKLEE
ncbi:hypothetical protein [Parasphingorhabdus sp.]|uniref:hypothetical protein n=1 Tax=Parasphingorhabdus sp. TaxID=2709688 RepID=UPI003A8D020F